MGNPSRDTLHLTPSIEPTSVLPPTGDLYRGPTTGDHPQGTRRHLQETREPPHRTHHSGTRKRNSPQRSAHKGPATGVPTQGAPHGSPKTGDPPQATPTSDPNRGPGNRIAIPPVGTLPESYRGPPHKDPTRRPCKQDSSSRPLHGNSSWKLPGTPCRGALQVIPSKGPHPVDSLKWTRCRRTPSEDPFQETPKGTL